MAAPGASGELSRSLTYFRTGATASLSGGTVLSYGTPARPPVVAATLGTAALRAPDPAAGQSSEIRYVRSFSGTVPAPAR